MSESDLQSSVQEMLPHLTILESLECSLQSLPKPEPHGVCWYCGEDSVSGVELILYAGIVAGGFVIAYS